MNGPGVTPIFRHRLDRKFERGAENQAFLVESVTGVETLKSMAVEPQMQRRWEEQLAGYVAASFRVISLGNTASQTVQFISKLVTAGILYFGAKLVIDSNPSGGGKILEFASEAVDETQDPKEFRKTAAKWLGMLTGLRDKAAAIHGHSRNGW